MVTWGKNYSIKMFFLWQYLTGFFPATLHQRLSIYIRPCLEKSHYDALWLFGVDHRLVILWGWHNFEALRLKWYYIRKDILSWMNLCLARLCGLADYMCFGWENLEGKTVIRHNSKINGQNYNINFYCCLLWYWVLGKVIIYV